MRRKVERDTCHRRSGSGQSLNYEELRRNGEHPFNYLLCRTLHVVYKRLMDDVDPLTGRVGLALESASSSFREKVQEMEDPPFSGNNHPHAMHTVFAHVSGISA